MSALPIETLTAATVCRVCDDEHGAGLCARCIADRDNLHALAAIGNRLIKTPHWKAAGLKEAFTLRQQQLVSGEKAEAARGAA